MLCTLHAGHNFWDYLFPGQDSFLFQDWLSTGGEEKEESACVCARVRINGKQMRGVATVVVLRGLEGTRLMPVSHHFGGAEQLMCRSQTRMRQWCDCE
jgi:hypothetical protein